MIQVSDLEFSYGSSDFRLRIPELAIDRGEKVAIIGPSGLGKSTLLMLLAGIISPKSGSIRMGEVQLEGLSDAARRRFRTSKIGLVFQELELIEYLSVRENILLPFLFSRSSRKMAEVQASAESLAEATGLTSKLSRRPKQLSQGERQRVAICRAMITKPEYLLVDEPTGSLDPRTASEVIEMLFRQARANDTTMLLVTHDYSQLDRFDRTINLVDLQITETAREVH